LGASTVEAEDNCASMVVQQLKDYLENGNISHAVNFPTISMARAINSYRITVAHLNKPNILGPITNAIAKHNINIVDMVNQSLNEVAYTIIDTETKLPDILIDEIRRIEGVLKVRSLI
jgi:D-3-phosphoglycerate dehydrogenase